MSPQDKIARKPFNPDRRCHWFDSNGRPYKRLDGGLGCPRSKVCYFAHPTDGEYWHNARPSGEPPIQHLTDDEYRLIVGRPRSPGRNGPSSHHGYHQQHYIAGAARHRSISPGRRRERSPGPSQSGSAARRRTDSRERAGLAASPPLAQRLRGRRSISREREFAAAAAVRVYGRSSRSRSPVPRGRARTSPSATAPRAMRPYGSIPDGPRNGNHARNPVVPKMETVDVAMKDVGSASAGGMSYGSRREESIASTRVSSRQPTSRVPAPASVSAASTNSAAPPPPQATASAAPNPDAVKSMLESSTREWQQISTAVAAAASAVPKASGQSVALGQLSTEEKHKIWTSRIELLAAATRIHNDCRSMENDIRDYKQLVESFSYQTLPAEDRTVIEGHLHTLQGQLAQKTDEMQKIVNNLSAAKFWPTYTNKHSPPAELDNSANAQEHKQAFATQTGALKGSVSQLQLLFKTVDARWENLSNQLQQHNRGSGGGNGNGETTSSPASTFLAESIVPTELQKIRDTLANFEDRLGALERGVQQDQSLLEQLDAIVAENVQAVVLASTGTVQAKAPEPRTAALTDEQLRTLQTLQQNAAVTGQHVARLSQEVAQLAGYNERLQTENMTLQAENVHLRQQLEEVRRADRVRVPVVLMDGQPPQLQNAQPSSSGDSTQADRMISEMRALNAAVRAYISQSSSSAHQPAEPTGDAVVKQLAPYLVKSIPELIAPQLQGLRDSLRATQTQVIQELSTKMTTTLQTVEAIRDLIVPGDGHPKSPSISSTQSSHHEGMAVNGVS
ncbi:hypothetical protein GSI_10876 [Ganoderma sinense ZZ0214-1]|uniref:Uncharacterized protein n=1 Tax=Ganoderma sinense ZZ0214-1 TaxID=1077348 RepID=A0A2G8S1S2_9APHY|nr:hypothetical protein GSI_10876 [Ganoderma sinense ZZ0214-1]